MDLRQLEYILKIAEEKNITKAAEKLYISQPALNQQLLNLEKELGTQLFQRKRGDWRVTEAGEIYVEAARRILDIKHNAYTHIAEIAETKNVELNVGVTPSMGGQMLSWMFRRFYSIYPEVRLHIHQANSHELQKAVISGALDLAVGTVTEDRDTVHCDYRELKTIEMLLIMSERNPLVSEAYMEEDGSLCMDIRKLREEYFALGAREGTNGELQERIFEEAGFVPRVYQEGGGWQLRYSMVEMNLCCAFMEEHHKRDLPQSVLSMKLSTHPRLTWVVILKKGRQLSQPARLFMELAEQYWAER